jgi:hypothetical protein
MVKTPKVRPETAAEAPETTRGMPYVDAERLFGAAAIRKLGTSQQRSNWKNREKFIHWEHLAPLMLARMKPAPACPLPFCLCPLHSRDSESSSMHGPGEAWKMIGKSWAVHEKNPEHFERLLGVLRVLTSDLPDVPAATTAHEGQNVRHLSEHTPTGTGDKPPRRKGK